MPVKNGAGRMKLADTFPTMISYLNNYLFPIKDTLFAFEKEMHLKKKEYSKAVGKFNLQKTKLDSAYAGLERFRGK